MTRNRFGNARRSRLEAQVRRDRAVDQYHRAARFRDDAAARRHQSLQPHLYAERQGGQQRELHGRHQGHRRQCLGRGAQRHDLRARLSGHGHVVGHVQRRRRRRRCLRGHGREGSRRAHQRRLAFLDRGAEGLRRRQAHRVPVAVLSRRQCRGAALFHRVRLRGGSRYLSAVQELDRHRRGCRRRCCATS